MYSYLYAYIYIYIYICMYSERGSIKECKRKFEY